MLILSIGVDQLPPELEKKLTSAKSQTMEMACRENVSLSAPRSLIQLVIVEPRLVSFETPNAKYTLTASA